MKPAYLAHPTAAHHQYHETLPQRRQSQHASTLKHHPTHHTPSHTKPAKANYLPPSPRTALPSPTRSSLPPPAPPPHPPPHPSNRAFSAAHPNSALWVKVKTQTTTKTSQHSCRSPPTRTMTHQPRCEANLLALRSVHMGIRRRIYHRRRIRARVQRLRLRNLWRV